MSIIRLNTQSGVKFKDIHIDENITKYGDIKKMMLREEKERYEDLKSFYPSRWKGQKSEPDPNPNE